MPAATTTPALLLALTTITSQLVSLQSGVVHCAIVDIIDVTTGTVVELSDPPQLEQLDIENEKIGKDY